MAPHDQQERIERRVTQLLLDAGLPLPDVVEYGQAAVRFGWADAKVALLVEGDGFLEREAFGDYDLEHPMS